MRLILSVPDPQDLRVVIGRFASLSSDNRARLTGPLRSYRDMVFMTPLNLPVASLKLRQAYESGVIVRFISDQRSSFGIVELPTEALASHVPACAGPESGEAHGYLKWLKLEYCSFRSLSAALASLQSAMAASAPDSLSLVRGMRVVQETPTI